MGNDDVLISIGNRVAAIDLKLEDMLNKKSDTEAAGINEIKSFFEQLAKVVSSQFIGDLPKAIEYLEKKIDQFDYNLKDELKSFSKILIDYENKLEERIKKEIIKKKKMKFITDYRRKILSEYRFRIIR